MLKENPVLYGRSISLRVDFAGFVSGGRNFNRCTQNLEGTKHTLYQESFISPAFSIFLKSRVSTTDSFTAKVYLFLLACSCLQATLSGLINSMIFLILVIVSLMSGGNRLSL